jgi:rubrerythrin
MIVAPYAPHGYVFEDPLARIDFSRLITDEETAEAEYLRLAEDPAVKQNELAHSTILGIAEDEKRHAQQLKDVLDLLVREKKIA